MKRSVSGYYLAMIQLLANSININYKNYHMKKLSLIAMAFMMSFTVCNAEEIQITKTGIGPIQIGSTIEGLPEKYAGLYDCIEADTEPSAYEYSCYYAKKNGEIVVEIQKDDFTQKVTGILILSTEFKTAGGFGSGSKISTLFDKGATVISDEWECTIYLTIVCDGFRFECDKESLTLSGKKKYAALEKGRKVSAFNRSDFKADAKVGTLCIYGTY